MREVAESVQKEVARQLGTNPGPIQLDKVADRPYNDQRYLIDFSKANKELGWTPKKSFEEGKRMNGF